MHEIKDFYVFFCLFFFVVDLSVKLCFTAFHNYFSHFELSQSVVEAIMGDPSEKPPDHLQAESHVPLIKSTTDKVCF